MIEVKTVEFATMPHSGLSHPQDLQTPSRQIKLRVDKSREAEKERERYTDRQIDTQRERHREGGRVKANSRSILYWFFPIKCIPLATRYGST